MTNKRIYSNSLIKLEIRSNSFRILNLLERFLDFDPNCCSDTPEAAIRFHLNESSSKIRPKSHKRPYTKSAEAKEIHVNSFGPSDIRTEIDFTRSSVQGNISGYISSEKERLLQHILLIPLQKILSRKGFFFLHASLMRCGKKSILICGPSRTGKSTLTYILSKNGFIPLSDDDCYVKYDNKSLMIHPFPTKVGLNKKLLGLHPSLSRLALNNFRYYGKRRIPLSLIGRKESSHPLKCDLILFPSYSKTRPLIADPLSKENAFRNFLSNTNLFLYSARESELIWTLYALAQKIKSYQLVYNDSTLHRVPSIINKIAGFNKR